MDIVDKSTLALVVSGLALLYTVIKSIEERRRWQASSLPRFVVSPQLVTWRQVTLEQFRTTDWGYADNLAVSVADRGSVDVTTLRIPTAIVAYDRKGGFLDVAPALTPAELLGDIAARGLLAADYDILKGYRVVLSTKNVGLTTAMRVETVARLFIADQLVMKTPESSPANLEPHEETWSHVDWYVPLTHPFPDHFDVELELQFTSRHSRAGLTCFRFTYDRAVGSFRRS